jgi:hypothetical protein
MGIVLSPFSGLLPGVLYSMVDVVSTFEFSNKKPPEGGGWLQASVGYRCQTG